MIYQFNSFIISGFVFVFCFFLFKFYTLYNQNKSLLVKQFVINTGVLFVLYLYYVLLRTITYIGKN